MRIHRMSWFVTALAALACVNASAADDPFVGTWKLNLDKSQVDGYVREIKDLGGKQYEWFGASVVIDGKEHPFTFGGTYVGTQESPNEWVATRKHDGKVTSVTTWTLSDGGQQLRVDNKGTRADGTPFTKKFVYTREGTGSGLAGKWKSEKVQLSSISDWVIKPYGNDGLSFAWPGDKEHQDLKFDGKDYPDEGPRVTPGATSCAKRVDKYTIQVTDKRNGKVTATHEAKVSQDGRTLTDTTYRPGQQKPRILVYEKEM
jgi:hypothetical protein